MCPNTNGTKLEIPSRYTPCERLLTVRPFFSLPQAHIDLPPVHFLNKALFSSYQSTNNVQYSGTFVEEKKRVWSKSYCYK